MMLYSFSLHWIGSLTIWREDQQKVSKNNASLAPLTQLIYFKGEDPHLISLILIPSQISPKSRSNTQQGYFVRPLILEVRTCSCLPHYTSQNSKLAILYLQFRLPDIQIPILNHEKDCLTPPSLGPELSYWILITLRFDRSARKHEARTDNAGFSIHHCVSFIYEISPFGTIFSL